MTRNRIALAFLALLSVAALGATLRPALGPFAVAEQSQPFSWETFLPERSISKTDWAAVIERGPLETFDALRREIIKNRIDAAALRAFETIVPEGEAITRIRAALLRLEGPERSRALADLYASFMSAPPSPDVLLDKLKINIASAFGNAETHREDNGRYFGWAVATNSYAAIIAFQNTGDRRFLNLAGDALAAALEWRDSETGRVDPFRGRAMHSWGGARYVEDGRHSTNVTLAGRMAFALALFAETALADQALHARYGDRARAFTKAARQAMDEYMPEFEVTPDGSMGYYVRPTHGNDIEPLNHMAWAGNALIVLHGLTGEKQYGRMAAQLARFFRRCMRADDNGALYWRYQPERGNFFGQDTEWVWKARTTALFIHFAWDRGVVFTDEDAKGVATMMLTRVFRPDGRISARIDGKFHEMADFKGFRGNYLATTPFIVFGDANPELAKRIEEMVASRPDIGGWMRGRHAIEAYAHLMKADFNS